MKRLLLAALFLLTPSYACAVDLVADLSWVNNATNATDIVIERQDGPNAQFIAVTGGVVGPTVSTFQDTILNGTEGLLYCYRANPRNAQGMTPSQPGCGMYVTLPAGTTGMNVTIKQK